MGSLSTLPEPLAGAGKRSPGERREWGGAGSPAGSRAGPAARKRRKGYVDPGEQEELRDIASLLKTSSPTGPGADPGADPSADPSANPSANDVRLLVEYAKVSARNQAAANSLLVSLQQELQQAQAERERDKINSKAQLNALRKTVQSMQHQIDSLSEALSRPPGSRPPPPSKSPYSRTP
ncbi:hypothetical protein TeGR_g10778, partial [Tetraparma gracilis]